VSFLGVYFNPFSEKCMFSPALRASALGLAFGIGLLVAPAAPGGADDKKEEKKI